MLARRVLGERRDVDALGDKGGQTWTVVSGTDTFEGLQGSDEMKITYERAAERPAVSPWDQLKQVAER